jgi:hypothetical protein
VGVIRSCVDDTDVSPSLPFEFTPPALVARIVRGALEADDVRLHGAIVAAIELHGTVGAKRDVFGPAIEAAAKHGSTCRDVAADAIGRHVIVSAA